MSSAAHDVDALRAGVFDLSADLLAVAGIDGCFKGLNPAWAVVLGFPAGDLLGCAWLDLVHPDDRAATAEAVASLDGGRAISFDNPASPRAAPVVG